MNSGFIVLHRKILDWEWYRNTNVFTVFLHLLLTVNFEDKNWEGIVVKRGQIVTSYDHLSYELSYNRRTGRCPSKRNFTVMMVRSALNKLKLTGEITSHSTNNYTIITVNNYSEYQDINKPTNRRVTNEQQADNKRITTTKQRNNINNINKERDSTLSSTTNSPPLKHLVPSSPEEITDECVSDIAHKLSVSVEDVEKCRQEMIDWIQSTGKKKKDYIATLRIWVRRKKEEGKIKVVNLPSKNVVEIEDPLVRLAERLRKKYEN